MKTPKSASCIAALPLLLCSLAPGYGQGAYEVIAISFDGPPVLRPGASINVLQYYECGMVFSPVDPTAPWAGIGRCWSGDYRDPANGSIAFVQTSIGESLRFSFGSGSVFSLLTVDLAEYSTVVSGPARVPFVGYRYDGTVITTEFTTDGIIDGTGPLADFETFHFGPEWNGLKRVEIPSPLWSLDNLVVAIPEPTSAALLSLGAAALALAPASARARDRVGQTFRSASSPGFPAR